MTGSIVPEPEQNPISLAPDSSKLDLQHAQAITALAGKASDLMALQVNPLTPSPLTPASLSHCTCGLQIITRDQAVTNVHQRNVDARSTPPKPLKAISETQSSASTGQSHSYMPGTSIINDVISPIDLTLPRETHPSSVQRSDGTRHCSSDNPLSGRDLSVMHGVASGQKAMQSLVQAGVDKGPPQRAGHSRCSQDGVLSCESSHPPSPPRVDSETNETRLSLPRSQTSHSISQSTTDKTSSALGQQDGLDVALMKVDQACNSMPERQTETDGNWPCTITAIQESRQTNQSYNSAAYFRSLQHNINETTPKVMDKGDLPLSLPRNLQPIVAIKAKKVINGILHYKVMFQKNPRAEWIPITQIPIQLAVDFIVARYQRLQKRRPKLRI